MRIAAVLVCVVAVVAGDGPVGHGGQGGHGGHGGYGGYQQYPDTPPHYSYKVGLSEIYSYLTYFFILCIIPFDLKKIVAV